MDRKIILTAGTAVATLATVVALGATGFFCLRRANFGAGNVPAAQIFAETTDSHGAAHARPTDGNGAGSDFERGFRTEFPVALGEKTLSLRLALTDLERHCGFTGARAPSGSSGMIFVYADTEQRAFWMRGVPDDLSIGFFDASGTLTEVCEMRANDTRTTRSRAKNIQFVLEMAPRWFDENGVLPGAKLDLEALARAVSARGFLPENFKIAAP